MSDAVMQESQASTTRASTGVEGLDLILGGGFPRRRSTLINGGAGSGKTVLALGSLVTGAVASDEPGIFVTFEESAEQLRENAVSFGWDLSALEDDRLFFLEARISPDTIQSGEFDFQAMLAGLEERARSMDARRIAFDGIDALLELLPDDAARRREMYRLKQWLERLELTGLITFKGEPGVDPHQVRYGFMEFLVDAVIVLEQRMVDRLSVRTVRVLKYRGSAFREGEFPLMIGDRGIEVATFDLQLRYPRSTERIQSGIPRLDTMLGGGVFRGSTVLISGASGTAKTTLAGAFAEAACERGERVLYVSFDEAGEQIIQNLASVGIELRPHADTLLRIHAARSEAQSAEGHLMEVRRQIREFEPALVIIDPISAFGKSGGHVAAVHAALRALDFAKSKGITSVATSLVPDGETAVEQTPVQVSTLADTWIHMEYLVRDGERNRTLTVVKSRGTEHSSQVRELLLSADGITLADVYVDGGEVLLGTSRWVREREIEEERRSLQQTIERERRALDLSRQDTKNELERLELELRAQEEQLERLQSRAEWNERRTQETREGIHRRRSGDGPPPPAVAEGGDDR